jgi:hypothetical protein
MDRIQVTIYHSDMPGYRVARAFERIPEITGLELTRNGGKWQGGYYLNGDRHAFRRDKLKVVEWKNGIWLFEEGGDCMSLENWLQQYGGARDYWDAVDIIEGKSKGFSYDRDLRHKEVKLQYVDPSALAGAKQYDLQKCSLFRWMCRMFPEERVRQAWDLYNVTTDSHGNAVYWYVDQNGKILYDKRILYNEDGHRDKTFFPGRQYRVADGYSGKCYFGANIEADGRKAFILESEKSAILGYLYYGRRFLATGGKGNLRDVEPGMMLCPDMDARIEWEEKGEVWPWWEKWGVPIEQIPEKADIGDMIEYRLLRNLE